MKKMNIPVLALIGVGLIVAVPSITDMIIMTSALPFTSNVRNITQTFDYYGFCCYSLSNNLTITGHIDSVKASMNETLASEILQRNGFTLLNYSTAPEGTHVVAAVQNGTGGQ